MLPQKPAKTNQLITAITDEEKAQGFLSVPTSPLLYYNRNYALTLRQSFEGIQVLGATGSGKSSGSGAHIARAMLHAGFGGLVLCAKPEEADEWEAHAKAAGRAENLYRFGKGRSFRFNFITHELTNGASPFDVAEIIDNARDALKPASSESSEGKYWRDAGKDLLVNAIVLLYGSTGQCALSELTKLIASAPPSREKAEDIAWQKKSSVFQHYTNAIARDGRYVSIRDVETAAEYFQTQYAPLGDVTRSSVVQNLMTTLNRFNYGMLRDYFTEDTNIVPELCQGGAIIVVDLPAMEGEDNRLAGHIWKYAFQRSAKRVASPQTRPMFIWADESQYFLNEKDVLFQSTARSAAVSTVYLTQTIDIYKHAIGGTERATTSTNAMLGNLRTHIFHANENPTTNSYAAEMIGKTLLWRRNTSQSQQASQSVGESWSESVNKSLSYARNRGGNSPDLFQPGGSSHNWGSGKTENISDSSNSGGSKNSSLSETQGQGVSEQKDYRVDPDVFANQLRSGNVQNDFLVDAVIVSPEIPEPYLYATFDQKHP